MSSIFDTDPTYDYNIYDQHENLPILFKECLTINCHNLIPYDLEKFVSEIIQTKSTHANKKILFEQRREGSQTLIRNIINDITKKLINQHNYKLEDFIILNASFPSEYNAELLIKYVERNNLLPIKTFFANSMETQFVYSLYEKKEINDILEYNFDYNQKIKRFLLYTGKCNTHRIYILSNLMKSGLLSDSYYSCYFEKNILENMNISFFAPYLQKSIEHIKSISENLPIKLDPNDKFESLSMWGLTKEEKFHYDHAFFGIVPETNFYHMDENHHEFHNMIDQVFITEKTYRMIAGKLPFIMVSFTKSLECLRESGYKTFHPFIDETYDLIENDELRLKAIITEIERLCNFSSSEWADWCKNIIPIVNYNQKVLLSCNPKYVEIY